MTHPPTSTRSQDGVALPVMLVMMLVMLVTMFPILGAYYLTRGGESVAGSGGK